MSRSHPEYKEYIEQMEVEFIESILITLKIDYLIKNGTLEYNLPNDLRSQKKIIKELKLIIQAIQKDIYVVVSSDGCYITAAHKHH